MSDTFSDDQLVTLAKQHDQEGREVRNKTRNSGWENTGFPIPEDGPPVAWVKYGNNTQNLIEEATTQEYIYDTLRKRPDLSKIIRVPQVYRVIVQQHDDDDDKPINYRLPWVLIVMEYVPGQTVEKRLQGATSASQRYVLWDRVVRALGALLTLEPPEPTPPPGPVDGGRIEHLIFGDYFEYEYAPEDYDSVEELQDYINETIAQNPLQSYGTMRRYGGGPSARRVDFASENFRLCYCDVHQGNFMLADGEGIEKGEKEGKEVGPIYVIDFRHCMWLPVSFMNWALEYNFRDPLFKYSRKKLELQKHLPSLEDANFKALIEFHARRPRE